MVGGRQDIDILPPKMTLHWPANRVRAFSPGILATRTSQALP